MTKWINVLIATVGVRRDLDMTKAYNSGLG